MPGSHAFLSPSASKRWLTCTPSARMGQRFAETESVEAAEGTLAHDLNECIINRMLHRSKESEYDAEMSRIVTHPLYKPEMLEYCFEYATFIIERYHVELVKNSSVVLLTETHVDLSDYAPESFGRGDQFIASPDSLIFFDFKYGRGVPVYAEDNSQCKLYALGAMKELYWQYGFQKVEINIYQPRINNISSWSTTVPELLYWGEHYVKPRAVLAFQGLGEYVAGDHCKFCRVATCVTRANFYATDAFNDKTPAALLSDQEVSDLLIKFNGMEAWVKKIKDHAIGEAKKGKVWPGLKLVEGRANRRYVDEGRVISLLQKANWDASHFMEPQKVKSVGQLESVMGVKDFAHLLNDLVFKPYGKATLVPDKDKRPPYDRSKEAADIFDSYDET